MPQLRSPRRGDGVERDSVQLSCLQLTGMWPTRDHSLVFVNGRLIRPREHIDGSFADAVDSLVGGDAQPQPVLPRTCDYVGRDARDLHCCFACPHCRRAN